MIPDEGKNRFDASQLNSDNASEPSQIKVKSNIVSPGELTLGMYLWVYNVDYQASGYSAAVATQIKAFIYKLIEMQGPLMVLEIQNTEMKGQVILADVRLATLMEVKSEIVKLLLK